MTIGVNNRNNYEGNGAASTYPYTYKIFSQGDLRVTVKDTDGNETTLLYPTHYTVTGVGKPTGGNVVLVNGGFEWLSSGFLKDQYTLSIRRVRLLTQSTDLRNQDRSFLPQAVEDQFDHQMMVDQQQQDEVGRSLKLGETYSGVDTTVANFSPGKYLRAKLVGIGLEFVESIVTSGAWLQSGLGAISRTIAADLGFYIRPEQFGAVGYDSVTDAAAGTVSTAAVQKAFDEAFRRRSGRVVLSKWYNCDADIVPQISSTSRSFTCEGDGIGGYQSSPLYGGSGLVMTGGHSLKIFSDTPPARSNAHLGVNLRGFRVINTNGTKAGAGIDVYGAQQLVVWNVGAHGYDYGLKVRSSWNVTVGGRFQFQDNNVGIKVPKSGGTSSVDKNEGVNALNIHGGSVANCVKGGISLALGNVISIRDVLSESTPVGVYLLEGLQHVTIGDVYNEATGWPATEVDRAGSDAYYAVIAGHDEDTVFGDTASPVLDLKLERIMTHAGESNYWLDNVNGVDMTSLQPTRVYPIFGQHVRNVKGWYLNGLNTISTPIVPAMNRAIARSVYRTFPHNWIPNGNFALPGLAYHVVTNGSSTPFVYTAGIDSKDARTLKIVCPNGQVSVVVTWDVPVPSGAEYAAQSNVIAASVHGNASSSDFASVNVAIKDQAGGAIAGATQTTGLTSWHTLTAEANVNGNSAVVSLLRVVLTLTRTTGLGDQFYLIDEIALFDTVHAELMGLSPVDLEIGLSGTGTCTTLSGAWRVSDWIDTGYGDANYFNVNLTSIYDSAQTTTDLQLEKGTSGNAGKFRVWSNKNSAAFQYRILPKVMRLP